MTCEQYERDLALAAEGDLPERESAPLEQHLQQCARCREFLQGLKESQRRLKGLAAEPIEEGALAVVRTRVLAVVSAPARPPRGVPAWGWALAAGLAIVALGLAMVVWRTKTTAPRLTAGLVAASPAARPGPPRARVPVETLAVTPTRRSPKGAAAPPSRRPSTVRPARAVSQGMEPETARVVPELSPDDADQLARAVVAVSRISWRRERPPAAPDGPFRAAVVRLETSDPGVVIYWQLDSNGG
jgi:hypothetical protein